MCRSGTWCVTLRAECGLGVLESEVLREVFGAKREEVRGGWKNCIVRSFMICAAEMGRALARGCVGVERCT